jgi:hypothetical protein
LFFHPEFVKIVLTLFAFEVTFCGSSTMGHFFPPQKVGPSIADQVVLPCSRYWKFPLQFDGNSVCVYHKYKSPKSQPSISMNGLYKCQNDSIPDAKWVENNSFEPTL